MKIGIIGTGKMGSRLGKLWSEKGHIVCFGSREMQKAAALAQEIGNNTRGGDYDVTAGFADVVVLAVPWSIALETVRVMPLQGKILIDITNAIIPGFAAPLGKDTSGAEEIAKAAPDAKVVKAFNGIQYTVLDNPDYNGQVPTVFYCGNDVKAKQTVHQLIEAINFDAVDAGPLVSARYVEALGGFWINLAFVQGMGVDMNFRLIRR